MGRPRANRPPIRPSAYAPRAAIRATRAVARFLVQSPPAAMPPRHTQMRRFPLVTSVILKALARHTVREPHSTSHSVTLRKKDC